MCCVTRTHCPCAGCITGPRTPVHLSCLPVCLSLSTCFPVHLSHPPVHLSCPPVPCPPVPLSTCPVHLSACPVHLSAYPPPTCPWLPFLSVCPCGLPRCSSLWTWPRFQAPDEPLRVFSWAPVSGSHTQFRWPQTSPPARPQKTFLRTESVGTPRGSFRHSTALRALFLNNWPRPTRTAAGHLQGGRLASPLPAVQMSPASRRCRATHGWSLNT